MTEKKEEYTGKILEPQEARKIVVETTKEIQNYLFNKLMEIDERQRYALANRVVGLLASYHFDLTLQAINKKLEAGSHL
jgi:hypothetical protein